MVSIAIWGFEEVVSRMKGFELDFTDGSNADGFLKELINIKA